MKHIPDAKALTWKGDLAARMVAGMDKYLRRATAEHAAARERYWKRDLRSWPRYLKSVEPNRRRLAKYLGVVDERVPVVLETVAALPVKRPAFTREGSKPDPTVIGLGDGFTIQEVRWSVLPGVTGQGLLLEPQSAEARASVICLPDADWAPEMLCGLQEGVPHEAQFARRLAESGCRVLIPTLIDRDCEWSGVAGIMTNQPHREFLYRAAFELGRHIIGLEVQKILAAVDWLVKLRPKRPVAIMGYGEGAAIAFHAAALDKRIAAAAVSGYFGPREQLSTEPIYRNVWRLLEEFGDAEIATLIAPRPLIVEACPAPAVPGPPPVSEGRSGAAPGSLQTGRPAAVEAEAQRAKRLLLGLSLPPVWVVQCAQDGPGTELTLNTLLHALDARVSLQGDGDSPRALGPLPDPKARLKRQFDELVEYTQALMRESEYIRKDYWAQADPTDVKSWVKTTRPYRRRFHEDVIGALPEPDMPPNPRARKVFATQAFTGYEVVLDVYSDVFAYGILLVPNGMPAGERRPVVVCQHGLEGRPQDVADPSVEENCYHYFACKLAERGFITFSPQNPYLGMDDFRVLQRMANPLGLSLFSFIIRQHQRILEFLKTLPYVDGQRMAFYGLSYGGKTAMRVPAVLEDYCLSICSGDFNEWIWKNCSTRAPFSYMRTGEYEMFEFDLGMTFNYAEMSHLICPRPFMVERGHWDGCSWDEWVAYEYGKTQFRYDLLGIGDRTEIEYFNGPHEIHAVGTFEFLEKHLRGGS